jgi:KaiC/GvpD/RAD55 family RecA-like ATPase
MKLSKIPTGIKTFDVNINEGFPAGSVILLLEDVGAGGREFLYTSIYNINNLKKNQNGPERMKSDHKNFSDNEMNKSLMLPNNICYVSISKSRDDILTENAYAFQKGYYEAVKDGVVFKELSDIYFRHSIAQNLWSEKKGILGFDCVSDKNILEELSEFMNGNAQGNIVIIDSLTDLLVNQIDYLNRTDFIMFLKGMVNISKTWNCLIYLILSANILEKQMQEIINDVVDGVLVFEWFDKGSVKMRRNLYISKFRGLIPQLEQNKIAKFETKITYDGGFEVSNVRKII